MLVIQILPFIINHDILFYYAWTSPLFYIIILKELVKGYIQLVISRFAMY